MQITEVTAGPNRRIHVHLINGRVRVEAQDGETVVVLNLGLPAVRTLVGGLVAAVCTLAGTRRAHRAEFFRDWAPAPPAEPSEPSAAVARAPAPPRAVGEPRGRVAP